MLTNLTKDRRNYLRTRKKTQTNQKTPNQNNLQTFFPTRKTDTQRSAVISPVGVMGSFT